MEQKQLGTGLRYNNGKLRFDLINPHGEKGLVKVLTAGSRKYEDHNWENGMKWSTVLASMKRHLNAFERGEDYDINPNCEKCQAGKDGEWICTDHSGLLHIDHLQANAHFLSSYYRIYPQGDDRFSRTRIQPKIGLDVDEVVADWIGAWREKFQIDQPSSWFFDYEIVKRFKIMEDTGELDEFYLSLKPKMSPLDIPFEPHCYVTSRPVSSEITKKWLEIHGFPLRPVITVGLGESKVEVIKNAGVDIFVDDRYENYKQLTDAGICCFLWDAPHNQRYEVGFKRIKSLGQIIY